MRRLYHKILFITTKSGYKQQIKVLENKKAPSLLMLLCSRMERAMGIEPTSRAWEVAVQILEDDMPARRISLKPLLYKRFKDFSF